MSNKEIEDRFSASARRLAGISDPLERETEIRKALADAYRDGMGDEFLQHLKGVYGDRKVLER